MGLLKTKTVWLGVAAIFTAIGLAVGGEVGLAETIDSIVFGLGLIFIRHGIAKVK